MEITFDKDDDEMRKLYGTMKARSWWKNWGRKYRAEMKNYDCSSIMHLKSSVDVTMTENVLKCRCSIKEDLVKDKLSPQDVALLKKMYSTESCPQPPQSRRIDDGDCDPRPAGCCTPECPCGDMELRHCDTSRDCRAGLQCGDHNCVIGGEEGNCCELPYSHATPTCQCGKSGFKKIVGGVETDVCKHNFCIPMLLSCAKFS